MKTLLASLGLLFVTLIIIAALFLMAYMYQNLGIIKLPDGLLDQIQSSGPSAPAEVRINGTPVRGTVAPIWVKPTDLPLVIDPLPTETWVPIPTDLPTPVPPLDPTIYRSETMLRLKDFAAALQDWLVASERLGEDPALQNDPTWRSQIEVALTHISETAQTLDSVGPPPPEYEHIDLMLEQSRYQADSLVANYRRALESASPDDFTQAGKDFVQVKEYLTLAATEMMVAGWPTE